MEVKNGCISNRMVAFQKRAMFHFHDYGRSPQPFSFKAPGSLSELLPKDTLDKDFEKAGISGPFHRKKNFKNTHMLMLMNSPPKKMKQLFQVSEEVVNCADMLQDWDGFGR